MTRLSRILIATLISIGVVSCTGIDQAGATGCPTVVAHRAVAPGATENTVEGITKAAASWVEIDVQRTKDGVLVLQHDTSYKRATDVEQVFPDLAPWYVKNMTYAQVQKLTVNGGFKVPTLDEALDAAQVAGKGVQVEAKNPKLYPWIGKAIDIEIDTHPVQSQVITFDETFLHNYAKAYPGTYLVWIHADPVRVLSARADFDAIASSQTKITASYVDKANAAGLDVQGYVVNSAADARRMQSLGVVSFTSDAPVRTATALTCD